MAANNKPVFVAIPSTTTAQISAANTNRDGTGTIVDVVTGDADGTRIERVSVKAVATTTAGMIRLYHYNGSSTYLIHEIAVTAATPSGTVKAWEGEINRVDGQPLIILPSTHKLRVSTHNAEVFNVTAHGGDFS